MFEIDSGLANLHTEKDRVQIPFLNAGSSCILPCQLLVCSALKSVKNIFKTQSKLTHISMFSSF